MAIKKTNAVIQDSKHSLDKIFQKAKEVQLLNEKIKLHLDPRIANECSAANLIGDRLILIVPNGSIATHIHFQISDLLKKFKTDPALNRINHIQCKVKPKEAQSSRFSNFRARMKQLSPATAQIINKMAEALDHTKLKEVMKKIASRTRHSRFD